MTRLLWAIALTLALISIMRSGTEVQAQNVFVSGRLSVTVAPTAPIYTAGPRGSSVLFCNRHTASVFLGGSITVSPADGFELLAGDCVTLRPYPRAGIYAVVGAAIARLDYAEGQYREP